MSRLTCRNKGVYSYVRGMAASLVDSFNLDSSWLEQISSDARHKLSKYGLPSKTVLDNASALVKLEAIVLIGSKSCELARLIGNGASELEIQLCTPSDINE